MDTINLLMDMNDKFAQKAVIKQLDEHANVARVVLEPLHLGMGHTLGNPLRRTLLSLMPGFAITGVAIENVRHEFDSIDGIKEDVIELLLNLRQVAVSLIEKTETLLTIEITGKEAFTAGDLQVDHSVQIHNPDLVLAHLNPDITLNMQVCIGSGQGYAKADSFEYDIEPPAGFIKLDAMFNPVLRASYKVNQASAETDAVNQTSDSRYDKLVFEIETNGSTSAKDAIQSAALIMQNCLASFTECDSFINKLKKEEESEHDRLMKTGITELGLGVRSLNCLQQENINTIGELVQLTEKKLLSINNLGRVSLVEIRQAMQDLELSLKAG